MVEPKSTRCTGRGATLRLVSASAYGRWAVSQRRRCEALGRRAQALEREHVACQTLRRRETLKLRARKIRPARWRALLRCGECGWSGFETSPSKDYRCPDCCEAEAVHGDTDRRKARSVRSLSEVQREGIGERDGYIEGCAGEGGREGRCG